MDQAREQRIRERAYQIREWDGRPDGRHELRWWLACEEIEREDRPPPDWWTSGTEPHPAGPMVQQAVTNGQTSSSTKQARMRRPPGAP